MTVCSPVSAEGLPRPATTRPSGSISSKSAGASWPLSRPVGVMRIWLPERTLKFPLVAGAQPLAKHHRAVAQSASTSDKVGSEAGLGAEAIASAVYQSE